MNIKQNRPYFKQDAKDSVMYKRMAINIPIKSIEYLDELARKQYKTTNKVISEIVKSYVEEMEENAKK